MQPHTDAETPAGPLRRIELLPNCSLTPAGAWLFFASVALASLTVATLFVLRGYWPVLPFAGLELALLGWALWMGQRRRGAVETIEIGPDSISIRRKTGGKDEEFLFSRYWAKVTLVGRRGWLPSRLVIGSHGRACEVGAFLTEEERAALGLRLAALVGGISDAPPLEHETPAATGGRGADDGRY